ncbi:MAG: ABC transporter ATP-binding protein [Deltaproteobacteria bacterium]|nr:ABC transporter ATP-binding protein [Deltaproteobacteria bacterium]MBW2633647.1 ABC transporter ATP-binding protein [Deltaproteobacteria bacterium]MBW2677874.1 ABC transporter ATP-binding protein [Deltaproteobacteria bacterium]
MKSKETILKVEGLCVDFAVRKGTVRVLNDLNLHLERGEALGIVGESGCGKSMTALSIMRLIPVPPGNISQGSILLDGTNLLALKEKQMQDIRGDEISMIFQEPMTSLNPVFTVGSQIGENIRRHQSASKLKAKEKAIEMLHLVGIPAPQQRFSQYPHELSGGMRQRVMIAMALSCQPSILIADEPTTALDVTIQAQIFDLLRDIQNRINTAIILITHDMGVIAEFAKRVIVMYAGRKVEEGPVKEIITDPRHPYTRGLIKCVPFLKRDPGTSREVLNEIPGIVPDLSRLGQGCPFAPRCNYATDLCRTDIPDEKTVGQNHQVICWHAEEIQ